MNIKDSFLSLDLDNRKRLIEWLEEKNYIELSNISKPCYLPKINRFFRDFVYLLSLDNKKNIDLFIDQFRPQFKRFNLLKDEFVRLLLMLIVEAIKNKDVFLLKNSALLLSLKFYGSIVHIFFPKFCSEEAWKNAIENLSYKHLIKAKQNISSFVSYISETLVNKYFINKDIENLKDIDIVSYIIELRTRLVQSIKSFAAKYYTIIKEMEKNKVKTVIGEEKETDLEKHLSNIRLIISNLCNSGEIDEKSFQLSFKLENSIKSDLLRIFLNNIFSTNNIDKLFFIINLLVKEHGIEFFCGPVNNLTLNVNKYIYDKKSIKGYRILDLIKKLYEETEFYLMYKNINTKYLFRFLLIYLIFIIRNRLCFSLIKSYKKI